MRLSKNQQFSPLQTNSCTGQSRHLNRREHYQGPVACPNLRVFSHCHGNLDLPFSYTPVVWHSVSQAPLWKMKREDIRKAYSTKNKRMRLFNYGKCKKSCACVKWHRIERKCDTQCFPPLSFLCLIVAGCLHPSLPHFEDFILMTLELWSIAHGLDGGHSVLCPWIKCFTVEPILILDRMCELF